MTDRPIDSSFGLSAEVLEKIRSVFAKHSQIENVIVYGSRAKGNYRIGSDIDLVISAPQLSTSELLEIENQLDELMLPYKIDLSILHHIENEELLAHIQRAGQVFYNKS